jgi:hypothetical protein
VTRPTDLPSDRAKRLAELECPAFETRPWVTDPALSLPPAAAFSCEVAHRLTATEPRWGPGFHSPPGALSSSCWPAPRMTPTT